MIHLPRPAFDANATSGSDNLGDLPEWDLTDLYASEDAPELQRDLEWLEKECVAFAADYEGKLASLDAAGYTCFWQTRRDDLLVPASGACWRPEFELRRWSNLVCAWRADFVAILAALRAPILSD